MKKVFLLIVFLSFFKLHLLAQNESNLEKLDESDLLESLELLGLHIFKFGLQSPDSTYLFTYIIEEYENGKLIKTRDLYEKNKGLPKEMLNFVFPKVDKTQKWLRFFCLSKSDSIEHLNIKFDLQKYDVKLKKKQEYSKYTWTQVPLDSLEGNVQLPLLLFHTTYSEQIISSVEIQRACVPSLNPIDLGKYFAHYFIVYLKLR